ncbi:MAG: hypothetical protein P8R54_33385 [Myxococcota bacterium]|nr:hypothetical protein [Myxococcota bacterium]
MSLLAILLSCGRAAPPPEPLSPEVVAVLLHTITAGGTATLALTARVPLTLTESHCAVWQDGVMVDTDTQHTNLRLPPHEEVRLDLPFEGLESGAVQLTGSLHLSGLLKSQELVVLDLSGHAGEVTP